MAADIRHIVVLMLENRSFDCMLGRLYPGDPAYGGLTLNESNVYGMTYGVWNNPELTAAIACTPDPDPGESFADMNVQLFGAAGRVQDAPVTMSGFALNYAQLPANEGWRDPGAVMHYFTPDQVPVLSQLAKAFGVCDQWFASAPCQTWPNRFFAHTGTSLGYVDNDALPIPFHGASIFSRLEGQGVPWRVYFHDMPQSILLEDVWSSAPRRFRPFSQFIADAHTGTLPGYSFIEPRYFADLFTGSIPNDQHPPHNVLYGEQLIAQVYNAVRSSPCWNNTLLIITYDEHAAATTTYLRPRLFHPMISWPTRMASRSIRMACACRPSSYRRTYRREAASGQRPIRTPPAHLSTIPPSSRRSVRHFASRIRFRHAMAQRQASCRRSACRDRPITDRRA